MSLGRDDGDVRSGRVVLALSVLLLFFTLPHVLEDFAVGEPAKKGVPAPAIAFVISALVAAQGVGLYWLGQRRARALVVHLGLGVAWPLAAAAAQVPLILSGAPYRTGAISVSWVLGIIVVGGALAAASLLALVAARSAGGLRERTPAGLPSDAAR